MTASLRDLLFLAGKAFLACLATILLGHAVGNPDHVSSTFVAVLSVSAVALAGLRTGLTQLAGSALGGVWGTLAALAGVPHQVAVPAAVALAIVTAFAVRAGSAYPIAAFTALYLVLVPRGRRSRPSASACWRSAPASPAGWRSTSRSRRSSTAGSTPGAWPTPSGGCAACCRRPPAAGRTPRSRGSRISRRSRASSTPR